MAASTIIFFFFLQKYLHMHSRQIRHFPYKCRLNQRFCPPVCFSPSNNRFRHHRISVTSRVYFFHGLCLFLWQPYSYELLQKSMSSIFWYFLSSVDIYVLEMLKHEATNFDESIHSAFIILKEIMLLWFYSSNSKLTLQVMIIAWESTAFCASRHKVCFF